MKSKVIKTGTLCGLLLLGALFSPFASAASDAGEILTLERAQELALENNPTLKILELEYKEKGYSVSVAKDAYEDARRDIHSINWSLQRLAGQEADAWKRFNEAEEDDIYRPIYEQEYRLVAQNADSLKNAIDDLVSARYDLRYHYELSKTVREEARHRLEDHRLILGREVEAKYYTLLRLDQYYNNLQASLDHLMALQAAENKKVSLGLSTPVAVANLGAQAENTGHLLRNTSTVRRLARQDFNNLLGRSLDSPLYLDKQLTPKKELVPHPGYGNTFLAQSNQLIALHAYVETQRERAKDLLNRYSKGTPEYLEAATKLERLELELAEAEQALLMGINNAYNRVQEAKANLRSQEAQNNLAQEQLRIGLLKAELGLLSRQEVRILENQALQAKTNCLEAVAAYNLAVTDYKLAREGIIVTTAGS